MSTQRQNQVAIIVKILLYPICGIVSLVILVNALSIALQANNPDTAIWLNPMNIDARINLVSTGLRKKNTADFNNLNNIIKDGRKYAPIDARLISLHGIFMQNAGSSQIAQEHFSTSLAILPTEYQALIYKFRYHFEDKQYIKALDIINVVSKRWPTRQNTFLQFIPAIALDTVGFQHASKLFTRSKELRFLIITALVKNPVTIDLAIKLVNTWKEHSNESIWALGNHITRKLVKAKKYEVANLAFRSFLSQNERNDYKYIFNGDFATPFLKNHFDWTIGKQVGVTHNVKKKGGNTGGQKLKSYLEIRFLDKPIQYINVKQLFKLSPGNYELKIDYFTTGLKTPKPIKVRVRCINPSKELTTNNFESADNNFKQILATFNVPSQNCGIAQIYFHTDFLAKSWRNRYSGILGINNISIKRVTN